MAGLGLLPFRNLGSRGPRRSRFFLSRPKKRSSIVRRACDEGAMTGRRQVQWVWGLNGRRVIARSSSQYEECDRMDSQDIPARAPLRDEIDKLITKRLPQDNNGDLKPMTELRHLKIDIA